MAKLLLFVSLITLSSLLVTVGADGGDAGPVEDPTRLAIILLSLLMALFPEEFGGDEDRKRKRPPVYPIEWKRRKVTDIMRELGTSYTKRAYRMSAKSFFDLHKLLLPYLKCKQPSDKKKWKNGSPNGLIISTVRLSIAIQYFAGGRPEDIALVHGVSHSDVFRSVWKVVDTVLQCPELAISFPPIIASNVNWLKGLQTRVHQDFQHAVQLLMECCFGQNASAMMNVPALGVLRRSSFVVANTSMD
jgi:hypothetical protein